MRFCVWVWLACTPHPVAGATALSLKGEGWGKVFCVGVAGVYPSPRCWRNCQPVKNGFMRESCQPKALYLGRPDFVLN